jgi:hypothetical protein
MRDRLRLRTPLAAPVQPSTRLGNWYVHLARFGHQQIVLATSERSLLTVLLPARQLRASIEINFQAAVADNNASALAERHLSETKDGSPVVSFFGKYDPKVVASRLDFGLRFLFQGARMVHGAFQVPAPEVEALAVRHERERSERAGSNPVK